TEAAPSPKPVGAALVASFCLSLHPKRLSRLVQLIGQAQHLFTLFPATPDVAEIAVALFMDMFAVAADFADGSALLRCGLGDLLGHAFDVADGGDDLIQSQIGGFGQFGSDRGVLDLYPHGLH